MSNLFENLQLMKENLTPIKESAFDNDFILDIVKMGYETGHQVFDSYEDFIEDEEVQDIEDKEAAWDFYCNLIDMGPAGFYEEYRDELDFDPSFIAEYSEDDEEFENLQTMRESEEVKPAELRTMSGTDIYAWQGANDFKDGSKPLIADGEYATMIVSGPDSSDSDEAIISIYFGDENEHWATSTFISKEKAIKYAKMLLPLLNEEIDDYYLKRFVF